MNTETSPEEWTKVICEIKEKNKRVNLSIGVFCTIAISVIVLLSL